MYWCDLSRIAMSSACFPEKNLSWNSTANFRVLRIHEIIY